MNKSSSLPQQEEREAQIWRKKKREDCAATSDRSDLKMKRLTLQEIEPRMSVRYVPNGDMTRAEHGVVSSKNDQFAFVKFSDRVSRLGWDGATSQACSPEDLIKA